MTAKTRTAKTAIHPCLCQSFEFGQFEQNSDTDYDTQCHAQTVRVFAQGHDAKLVGFMVRAEMSGDEIRVDNNGVLYSFQGAVHAAGSISDALAAKAQAQLDAARARIAKKASREASKAARKSRKAATEALVERQVAHEMAKPATPPKARQAKIKVGRWTYDATIEADGTAVYSRKLGGASSAPKGTYTLV